MTINNKRPAPGYRGSGSGVLGSVGYSGFSYSSSVSDTNGMNLYFSVTWLYPSGADHCASGFQLRCLSE